jgi:Family of unknown function (DUF5946)
VAALAWNQRTARNDTKSSHPRDGAPRFVPTRRAIAQAAVARAQSATADTKPMPLFFALAGLLLHVERGFSGHEVQRVHMLLAKHQRQYPRITLPGDRGMIGPAEVLAAAAGTERDAAIEQWCRSVWKAYRESRGTIAEFLQSCNIG